MMGKALPRLLRLSTVLLLLAGNVASVLAQPLASRPELELFVREMVEKHGFDRDALLDVFRQARIERRILEIMNRPVKRKTWNQYRPMFVNQDRIRGGIRFWRENEEVLSRARRIYGVPPEIITAVIGVESHYGQNTGRYRVLDALATLAFDYPPRGDAFRVELEDYLLLAREEGFAPPSLKGSFAGAMGIAQFMPGSYRRYGVDFDGDGRRDLLGNVADAIGSVAHYLSANGWRPDQPVAVPAHVLSDLGESRASAGLDSWQALSEWKAAGISPREEISEDGRAILIDLRTDEGLEHWLGFDSFHALTRYNPSKYYAMAVYQLGREIHSGWQAESAGEP